MPDGVNIPGGPSFAGTPQPPDVPCDPAGDAWRGEPGSVGPMGPAGPDSNSVVNVLDHGAKGDGSTDDTAAIQNVLNTYAGKATVFVPDTGNAYMVSQLTVPSGTDLLIHGLVKGRPGSTSHMLYVNNAGNVHIRGHGTLDGNGAVNPYPGSVGGTLFILSSTNVQVSGLTIAHAPLWNLVAQQSYQVLFSGLTIVGGRNASGFSVNCDICWLMNCLIDGPDADIGFSFYGGTTNSGAIGNVVRNSGGTAYSAVGINVLSDTAQTAACRNIEISNNIIHNCGGSGIEVLNAGNPTDHGGIIISNNRCYSNGKRPIGSRGDIHINGATNVMVIGNTSENFGSNTDHWFGLYASSTSGGVSFIGNFVSGTGQGGANGIGLQIDSCDALLASGNYFVDNATTPTMVNSIAGTAGAQNAFIGNHCARPLNITLQTDSVFSGAVGGRLLVNNQSFGPLPTNAASDAAASAAGVPVGGMYRNGSALQVRVV